LDFNKEALAKSAEGLDRIYGALEKYNSGVSRKSSIKKSDKSGLLQNAHDEFLEAMCDDLNTPKAMAVLFDLTRKLNSMDPNDRQAADVHYTLLHLGELLGLFKIPPHQWFKTPRIREMSAVVDVLGDKEIDTLIEQRKQAREDKNWDLADEIRDKLQAASILLEDRDGKTIWRRK